MDIQFDKYFLVLQNIATRYYLLGGLVFLLFYVVLKNKIVHKKIQSQFPKNADYLREIGYSTLTMLMFAFIPILFIYNPAVKPHTTLFQNITDYGWVYYFAAFPIMFVIHDTYFYWTHRIMHQKSLFNVMHLVHHKSTNPSPWAAYAFHPLEAIVEVGIFAVFLFTVIAAQIFQMSSTAVESCDGCFFTSDSCAEWIFTSDSHDDSVFTSDLEM